MNSNQPEIKIENKGKFLKWLENYWYHYKWHTIIISFFVVVIAICAVQSISTTKYDVVVTYAGPQALNAEQRKQFDEVLCSILPPDSKGKTDKKATLNMFRIFSEEQIKQITSETDSTGANGYVDRASNAEEFKTYTTHLSTGESSVYLLDPSLYEKLPEEHRVPLAELFGEDLPRGAMADGYGIRLGDTLFYKTSKVISTLPADTIICLKKPIVWGKASDEARYEYEKQVFMAIATYIPD